MVSSNTKHNHNNGYWPPKAVTTSFLDGVHSFTNAGSLLSQGGWGTQVIGVPGKRVTWKNTDFKNLL